MKIEPYQDSDLETSFPLNKNVSIRAWKILISNPEFNEVVIKARKKLAIPSDGLNEGLFNVWLENGDIGIFKSEVEKILNKFKLRPSNSWYIPIMLYLGTNQMSPPFLTEFFIGQKKDGSLEINITNQLNKATFFQLLNERWDEIESIMSLLPRLTVSKTKSIDLFHEIYRLKTRGHTFAQIADILSDKYPEDESGRFNENNVKTIYHRYKKFFGYNKN